MMKIMGKLWEQNEQALKEAIAEYTDEQIRELDYKQLVYLVFHYIWNRPYDETYEITYDDITEIDHGSYQGTLFYVISVAYDPVIPEYLTTYVEYGSTCCGCDTLQSIQYDDSRERQNKDLLELCRDIAEHTKCPYATSGWGSAAEFEEMTIE